MTVFSSPYAPPRSSLATRLVLFAPPAEPPPDPSGRLHVTKKPLHGHKQSAYRRLQFDHDPACRYCGCEIESLEKATLDHMTPRSRNGGDGYRNLVLCCQPCQLSKAACTLEEWIDGIAQRLEFWFRLCHEAGLPTDVETVCQVIGRRAFSTLSFIVGEEVRP